MACTGARALALLTSRLGAVARPGAAVWIGSPAEPAARWRSVGDHPCSGRERRAPLGIAGIHEGTADGGAGPLRVLVALTEKTDDR